jgi:hypothetical protein
VLLLLGRSEDASADALATACVLPAVEKMLAALAGSANPYASVLRAVRSLLAARSTGNDRTPFLGWVEERTPVPGPRLPEDREGREP